MERQPLRLDPVEMTGTRFKKQFGEHGWYEGTVVGRRGRYYQVEYEDGDGEEMTAAELGEHVHVPAPFRPSGGSVSHSWGRWKSLPGGVVSEQWEREQEKKRKEGRKGRHKGRSGKDGAYEGGGKKGKVVKKLGGGRDSRSGGGEEAEEGSGGGFRAAAEARLMSGLAEGTQSKYRTTMKYFRTYMFLESLDWDDLALEPRDESIVAMSCRNETIFMGFAEYLAVVRGVVMRTTGRQYITNVKSQLVKINKYDPMYGQKWKRMNMLLGRLEVAYPSTPKRRDGFLQQHLLLLREKLDLTKRPSKMYWALVLLLFFGVSRKGDHLPPSRIKFNAATDTTVSDVTCDETEIMMVNIKQTKTRKRDHLHAGKPLVRDKGNPLCPMSALEDYMASAPLPRGEDPNQVPLFRHGDGSAVSGDDLNKFVKLAAEGIGLNPEHFSGHSLRIGGATAALACDSGNEYCVKIMGMWIGDSVQLYTRPTMEMLKKLLLEMMRKKKTVATSTLD
jgi:hypothetical protein